MKKILEKCTCFLFLGARVVGALVILAMMYFPVAYADDDIPFEVTAETEAVVLDPGSDGRVDLNVYVRIPEDHFIYRDKAHFKFSDTKNSVAFNGLDWPATVIHDDPFFKKKSDVWEAGDVVFPLHFQVTDPNALPTVVSGSVVLQGCSAELCFRPVTYPIRFEIRSKSSDVAAAAESMPQERSTESFSSVFSGKNLSLKFEENVAWGLGLAFLGGLFTDFTPCVLPLIPLILLFIGIKRDAKPRANLAPSLALVAGMSTTYVLLGLLAVALGWNLGFIFQNRAFLLVLVVFFAVMGLALWDVIDLSLPPRFQTALSNIGGKGIRGGFVVGLTVGLVALPCVGPVIGALLLYVAASHDWMKGALYLLAYGLGMGSVFVVAALFYGKWRRFFAESRWTVWVKKGLGVLFVLLALYYGAVLIKGILPSTLLPQSNLNGRHDLWYTSFPKAAVLAKAQQKPMVLDFRADWCLPCIEMEKNTFKDERVSAFLQHEVIAVRVDCTQMTPACETLVNRYDVVGFPTLLFLDSNATPLSSVPLLQGYTDADEFLAHIKPLSE